MNCVLVHLSAAMFLLCVFMSCNTTCKCIASIAPQLTVLSHQDLLVFDRKISSKERSSPAQVIICDKASRAVRVRT